MQEVKYKKRFIYMSIVTMFVSILYGTTLFVIVDISEMHEEISSQLKSSENENTELQTALNKSITETDKEKKRADSLQLKLDSQPKWKSMGVFKITYYGLDITTSTASMMKPEIGKTIGVDPSIIPYGTKVKIENKIYEAQDTGNYTGNHIDILCESESISEKLGTHNAEVFIIPKTGGN